MPVASSLLDCTTQSLVPTARSVCISSQLCDADPPDWRRPGCSDRCRRDRVLVADGAYRGWRLVESHDHAAYERGLEQSVRLLAVALGHCLQPDRGLVRTGRLAIDLERHVVAVGGREVGISPGEWAVLACLASHLGVLVERDEVLAVYAASRWGGRGYAGPPTVPVLRNMLFRLRTRLGPAGPLVQTVNCLGYRLRAVTPEVVS
jgi:DNA-binding winged helix-turn-helix (wHTH) protein